MKLDVSQPNMGIVHRRVKELTPFTNDFWGLKMDRSRTQHSGLSGSLALTIFLSDRHTGLNK